MLTVVCAMDKSQRRIRRSPSVKRRSKVLPVGQRLTLERVLGLTVSNNAAFTCDAVSGVIAYPAGCVAVLFNPRKNRQSHIFNVSKKTITSMAFSADGKHLVTGECGHQPAVRVWEVEEKSQVAEFHGHKFGVNCVAFSPNLRYIVSIGSQHDMMVNVWNWKTGNKVASNKVSCKVSAVAFGADSSFFVTVGNRHVKFWYLDSSQSKINQTVPLLGHSGILGEHKNNYFCDVACGQGKTSGNTYVITQSGLLCEFNDKRLLEKWVELRTKRANCITAGEEHIFIGYAGGVVRVFSASSLQFVATLPHPHHLGVDVATATSSSDLICMETNAKYPDVVAITLDDKHKKVSCIYNDHSLYVWDVENLHHVGKAWSFLFHSGCVWALEVYPHLENGQTGALPPGSFLTASSDNTIRVWNLDPRLSHTPGYAHNIYSSELLKVVYTDPTHSFLCDINYNPAGGTDKTDTTWDGKNGVRSIRVSPDGEHLASGDRQGNVRIFDLQQMSEIRCIEAHESDVVCLEYSFSKAGPKLLASGSRDRLIHVFDVEQHYGLLQTLDDHSAAIQSVHFTDANNRLGMLSCGSDKSLLFRNATLNAGEFEFSLDQHLVSKSTMYDMIIHPTHKFVATACQDRSIRVYNMKTAKQKKKYCASLGDEGTLLRVQLDPSGTYVATSCTDKNVCVLEFYTGELTATVYGHSEIITGLRFTNDLKHLISVSADGCIFVWRLSSEMTKTMRMRMEELGKMPKDETFVIDQRTIASPPLFPMTNNISPSTVLSCMEPHPLSSLRPPSSYPDTPVRKRVEASPPLPSPAYFNLFAGPLPSWAKAKLDDTADGVDEGVDTAQPRGRWAQRYDHNLSFKSQLELSQMEEADFDARGVTRPEGGGLQGGMLASSLPDLRRETVVLSQQHLPARNIPIIDDDDETNVDDDEDFYPADMKDALPRNEKDCHTFDVEGRRRSQTGDSLGGWSDRNGDRRWSYCTSLGSEDMTRSTDFDDMEDSDAWPDATKIVYPPSKLDVTDPCDSTFQVYAAEEVRKRRRRHTTSFKADEDGETGHQVPAEHREGDSSVHDDMVTTSTTAAHANADHLDLPHTSDKEQFVKENFESVTFTPVAMDKFVQQVASVEEATDVSCDQTGIPFSPRLSLSSRFLSRSRFVGVRSGARLGTKRNVDNPVNPEPKSKTLLAQYMEDMRSCLASSNWRTGGLLHESPEKDVPLSPPTKLKSKELSFSSPVATTFESPGTSGSASPRNLHHALSYRSIRKEQTLPRIPIPRTLNVLKEKDVESESEVSGKNNFAVRIGKTALKEIECNDEGPLSPTCAGKESTSDELLKSQTPQSASRTLVSTGHEDRSQASRCAETCQTVVSTPLQLPHSIRSLSSKSGHSSWSSERCIRSPQTSRSCMIARSHQYYSSPVCSHDTKSTHTSLSQPAPISISRSQNSKSPLSLQLSEVGQSTCRSNSPSPFSSEFSVSLYKAAGKPAESCSSALSHSTFSLSHLTTESKNSCPTSVQSCPASPVASSLQRSCLKNGNACTKDKRATEDLLDFYSEGTASPQFPHLLSERCPTPKHSCLVFEKPRNTSPQSLHMQPEGSGNTSHQSFLLEFERSRRISPEFSHLLSERSRDTSPQSLHLLSERSRDTSPQSLHLLSKRSRDTSPQSLHLLSERSRDTSPQFLHLLSERSRDTSPQSLHLLSERSRDTSPQSLHLLSERSRDTNPQSLHLLSERSRDTSPQSLHLQSERSRDTSPQSSHLQSERSRGANPQSSRLCSDKPTSPQSLNLLSDITLVQGEESIYTDSSSEKGTDSHSMCSQSDERTWSESSGIPSKRSLPFPPLQSKQEENTQSLKCVSIHPSYDDPASPSAAGLVFHASCHASSSQLRHSGSEWGKTAGKFETENYPTHYVQSQDLPSSTSQKIPCAPTNRKAHARTSNRGRRASTDGTRSREVRGSRSSSVPPSPCHAPSYCRTTKSSRLKSASSSNLLKQTDSQHSSAPTAGDKGKTTGGKTKKSCLTSSYQARHKSTPNLIVYPETGKKVSEKEGLPRESSSNLCRVASLSLSEPDICGIENHTTKGATAAHFFPTHRNREPGPQHPHTRMSAHDRMSVHAGNTDTRHCLPCQDGELMDTHLMPPPSALSDAQRSLLRRAAQARKGLTSDLTLEQAKSILLGNSGILESPHVSTVMAPATSVETSAQCPGNRMVHDESDISTASGSSVLHQNSAPEHFCSTAVGSPVSSHNTPLLPADFSPSTFHDATRMAHHGQTNSVPAKEEVVLAASQPAWDRKPVASTDVDTTRFDVPEHDQPKSQSTQPCAGTVNLLHNVFDKEIVSTGASGACPGRQDSERGSVQDEISQTDFEYDSSRSEQVPVCSGACHCSSKGPDCGENVELSSLPVKEGSPVESDAPCHHSTPGQHESQHCLSPQSQTLSPEEQTLSTCSQSTLSPQEQTLSTCSQSTLSPQEQTLSTCSQSTLSPQEQTLSTCSQSTLSPQEQTLSTCSQSTQEQSPSVCCQSPQGQSVSCSQSPHALSVKSCSQSPHGLSASLCSQSPQGLSTSLCSQSPQGLSTSLCSQSPHALSVSSCSQSPQGLSASSCSQSPQGLSASSCSQSPAQSVSPRSQCDTGLGSDTDDTDCDARQSAGNPPCGEEQTGGRSSGHPSPHSHNSFTACPHTQDRTQDLMTKCTNVVADLEMAIQRTKDLHAEVTQSSPEQPAHHHHHQMMSRLSEAIHQAHLTLAELALHPSSTPLPRSCPLTGGEPASTVTRWDRDVMEQAGNMLRPLMWGLSQELCQEVVKVVREQLEGGPSS